MFNGFLKVGGFELFGTYETAKGRSKIETNERTASQLAGDQIYRFGKTENIFAGVRYNTVKAQLAGIPDNVKVISTQLRFYLLLRLMEINPLMTMLNRILLKMA